MNRKNWRSELDNVINNNIDELIKETKKYDNAIKNSKDKSKAQLWVALAIINSKLNQISLNKTKSSKKLSENEINDILSKLENY